MGVGRGGDGFRLNGISGRVVAAARSPSMVGVYGGGVADGRGGGRRCGGSSGGEADRVVGRLAGGSSR